MKLKLLTPLLLLVTMVSTKVMAQNRPDKLYSMSGIGFAFPIGETSDYFKPKFSTSLGLIPTEIGTVLKALFWILLKPYM